MDYYVFIRLWFGFELVESEKETTYSCRSIMNIDIPNSNEHRRLNVELPDTSYTAHRNTNNDIPRYDYTSYGILNMRHSPWFQVTFVANCRNFALSVLFLFYNFSSYYANSLKIHYHVNKVYHISKLFIEFQNFIVWLGTLWIVSHHP